MAQVNGTMPSGANAGDDSEDGEVVETVTQETAGKAQLVVAAHSADPAECAMLLAMLGIGEESAT